MIIEGFFYRIKNHDIFYAKGVVHPNGYVVSFPKYVVDQGGERIDKNGVRYRKLPSLDAEFEYVVNRYSEYVRYDDFFCRELPFIPLADIVYIYNPIKKAEQILTTNSKSDAVLRDVKEMLSDIIAVSGARYVGISGSILVGLHTSSSDLDIVVYGVNDCRKVYDYLREAIGRDPRYSKYKQNNIDGLYSRRAIETPISLDQMLLQESRRVLEGYFKGREYFVRLVKFPWEEPGYGVYRCKKLGKALVKLRVIDAKESIYTPCRYKVEVVEHIRGFKVDIDEVYSYRGRFAEIVLEDEVVEAYGTVELVEISSSRAYYRLYLGDKGDYLKIIR